MIKPGSPWPSGCENVPVTRLATLRPARPHHVNGELAGTPPGTYKVQYACTFKLYTSAATLSVSC